MHHSYLATSRREFLRRSGGGFGALALASLLAQERALSSDPSDLTKNPLAAKAPPLPAKAKAVIWCFMDGGPSHLDLFDPKPALNRLAGKPLPGSFEKPVTAMGVTSDTPLLGSKRTFKQHGDSGIWVSDWLPHMATCVDEMTVLRSCAADGQTHVSSVTQMNTGNLLGGRPCVGAWALYGLGSVSAELPGFVVMTDYSDPPGSSRQWGAGFMPAIYQGTKFNSGKAPILDVQPIDGRPLEQQRAKLDYIQRLNERYAQERAEDNRLAARVASYELAYRMQSAAPEVADFSDESAETLALYGMEHPDTATNARNCLLARRLVERGVRFVQLYMGSGTRWDAHTDVEGNHQRYCAESDRPIAALIKDLKRRGLLDSTLVIWGGEFGRTPMSESGDGRDHNPWGFTMCFAGGGVKRGLTYGTTDEIGLYAIENRAHINDIHATILHLLGWDHEQLTFYLNGRDERLTGVAGQVIRDIVA